MPPLACCVPRQRVLVVNDDGIDAPGLRAVVVALAARFDVYVCAPAVEKSASSHAINIHAPVFRGASCRARRGARVRARRRRHPSGLRAMLALDVLFADDGDARAFDVVVSGVNRGENCGRHVVYSGTVAAGGKARCAPTPSASRSRSTRTRGMRPTTTPRRRPRASWRPSCWARTTAPRSRALLGKTLNVNVPVRRQGASPNVRHGGGRELHARALGRRARSGR